MKAKEKLIKQVIKGFQNLKGKASCYCFNKNVIPELVYNIISPLTQKHGKSCSIFIVVDSYITRHSIIKYLNEHNINLDDGYNIKCLSKDYINEKYKYIYTFNLLIGVNDNINIIDKLAKESKFTLSIFTENIMNHEFINNVRKILPCINTADLDIAIRNDYIYSPVEEHQIGVDISNNDEELYNKYTEYITECISIFNDISNIEKCKYGDNKYNISAIEYRNNFAYNNGWREDLDTTISFMKQIDDIYNPNVLYEKACNFYNIARQRRELVLDNIVKLEIIKDICITNKDKKILIVSKRGEFAATITKYLKDNNILCENYHDCIENIIDTIKTGPNKGKLKTVCWQAQSTRNEKLFNNNSINVLSIKYSSNPKLKIACNIVILTSPLCEDIISIKSRFSNIEFIDIPTITYKIYCNNTIESDKLNKDIVPNNVSIINETQNKMSYNENSGNIIL